jgi:hypothetical protein
VQGAKASPVPAPFRFEAMCRLASFNTFQGQEYCSLQPAENYGLEIPEGEYEMPLRCRIECAFPENLGLKSLVRVKGRFALHGKDWQPDNGNQNNFRRGQQQPQQKVKTFENHRFVIESIEVVK